MSEKWKRMVRELTEELDREYGPDGFSELQQEIIKLLGAESQDVFRIALIRVLVKMAGEK